MKTLLKSVKSYQVNTDTLLEFKIALTQERLINKKSAYLV